MEMAAATPAGARIAPAALQAGDVVLFGPDGPGSSSDEIDHAGLVLGGGWFVHASNQGVSLDRLDAAYYQDDVAFGIRPPG
jgi:cell wall-associated NlpC family hydrolase